MSEVVRTVLFKMQGMIAVGADGPNGDEVQQALAALAEAEAREHGLRDALYNIESGMAPSVVVNHIDTDSKLEFHSRMWTWSQQRAREALSPAEPDEDKMDEARQEEHDQPSGTRGR